MTQILLTKPKNRFAKVIEIVEQEKHNFKFRRGNLGEDNFRCTIGLLLSHYGWTGYSCSSIDYDVADNSLKIFGQKYALHIVRNMLVLKQNRFGQFLGSIEGINTKTLSIRLRELEDFGIIKRTILPTRPVQTEYSLTDKGMALEPLLVNIATFSARYESKTIFKDARPRMTFKQIFRAERPSEIYDY